MRLDKISVHPARVVGVKPLSEKIATMHRSPSAVDTGFGTATVVTLDVSESFVDPTSENAISSGS
jgi:hypothetical protein